MLPAAHSKCTLSQKCSAFQLLEISHIVHTAEERYAQAKGAAGASLAAHKAATNSAADSIAAAIAILAHGTASADCNNPTTVLFDARLQKKMSSSRIRISLDFLA